MCIRDSSSSPPKAPPAGELRAELLAWYDRARRDLPWRAATGERPDPWHVLVSELMLQAGGGIAIELQHGAPQLIERINTYFGYRAVRQLRLLQMPLPPASAPSPPPTRPLRAEDEATLAAGVAAVDDSGLREALLALGRSMGRTRP